MNETISVHAKASCVFSARIKVKRGADCNETEADWKPACRLFEKGEAQEQSQPGQLLSR
jgi:hypothetical protein